MISFFYYMIYDMISYMISVRLQLQILPRHSALMQTMVGMSVMLTWTDQWMPTRSETMLTWRRLRRHAAGQGQQQQALRDEHLDVALRQVPLPHGVYCGG